MCPIPTPRDNTPPSPQGTAVKANGSHMGDESSYGG